MKRIQRALAALMAITILMMGVHFSFAEESEVIKTVMEQIGEATATPTSQPMQEPISTEESTAAPAIEVTAEPIEEPTIEVTAEPTEEPTIEVTVDPTVEETIEETPEPVDDPIDEVLPKTAQELVVCVGLKLSEIAEAFEITEEELLAMSADEIEALYARIMGMLNGASALAMSEFVIENGVLKQYNGTESEVVIPEDVSEIGERAFEGNISIRSVSIPNSVKCIGKAAFMGCSNLVEVSLGNRLLEMGDFAFAESGIKSVTIPGKLKIIPAGAFNMCTSLTEVVISEGVAETKCGSISKEDVDCGAFMNCSSLKHVSIPGTMKVLGKNTFKGCTALTEIMIPSSVTSIGEDAFDNCSKATIWVYENSPAHEYCDQYYKGSWKLIGDMQVIEDSVESSFVMSEPTPELRSETLRITGKDVLIKGASTELKVYNASDVKLDNRKLSWSSDDPNVAAVSNGKVTA